MPYRDPTRRHEFAPEEIGRTAISRLGAGMMVLAFLLTIALPPALDLVTGHAGASVWSRLAHGWDEARTSWREGGFFAANRALLSGMKGFENQLEDESLLRERLLPPVQGALTHTLGLGNEQAYVGRRGWLFYRADIDHVTGKGFLDASVQRARRRAGDATEAAVQPDPLPALIRFRADLAARGVQLVLMPAPVKPMVEPQHFSRRYTGSPPPLRNPSWRGFRERLAQAGIPLLDVAPQIEKIGREDDASMYLATDTHWTPAGMEIAAELLAQWIEKNVEFASPATGGFSERRVEVSGRGDVATMLKLSEASGLYPPQSVVARPVIAPDGGYWQPDPSAEILLLGDSFTNIFSDTSLGWGSGAGLAERLAFHLQRPVDRIARNAGGAYATREQLGRELSGRLDRLKQVKVVVYEFAARELSQGDWKVLAGD